MEILSPTSGAIDKVEKPARYGLASRGDSATNREAKPLTERIVID